MFRDYYLELDKKSQFKSKKNTHTCLVHYSCSGIQLNGIFIVPLVTAVTSLLHHIFQFLSQRAEGPDRIYCNAVAIFYNTK